MRRTNNDIFRQLEELMVENEKLRQENTKLRAENRSLRAENARVRERIQVLEMTLKERINKAVKKATDSTFV